jgi:hypothetical protein
VAAELRVVQERRMAEAHATRELDAARRAVESRVAEVDHRQGRLLDYIRGLDGASTLSEVLDALGVAIGREASRAAVLVLRADRLVGWKLSGFGPRDMHPKAVDISVSDGGLAGKAVLESRPVASDSAPVKGLLVDEPDGTEAVAVPVLVVGRVVAVVYASQHPEAVTAATNWRDTVEILVRHGARCLEALTVQKASATSPPRFWVPAPTAASGEAGGSVDPSGVAVSTTRPLP